LIARFLIELPADEPERARRFWEQLLEATLESRRPEEGRGWQTEFEGIVFGLHERGPGPGDRFSLPYFPVADLAAAVERVRALGGEIVHRGERWVICRDSEGSGRNFGPGFGNPHGCQTGFRCVGPRPAGFDRERRLRRVSAPHRPKETVRRHAALVPLSQEHQHELAQARRLHRAADAGPERRLAVASAYVDAFFTETVEHFRREEEILFPLYVRHAGSTPMLERILREHMELHGLVRALRAEAAAGDIPPEALRSLGDLLHDHVRVEERELFEEIERLVPAAELERLRL
jgi:predicted enzyme related to lactoylglutathione lyase